MTRRSPEREGTIRFAYALETPAGPVVDADVLARLQGWRGVLWRLGLVGQDPDRYGGLGFGNLSVRDPGVTEQFVITASQTGGLPRLADQDLVRIVQANVERFWVDALGHQPPSSESLTHAMIYRADPAIGWIFHVHSAEIWAAAGSLGLAETPADTPYGSPAMAGAVTALLRSQATRPVVFVTAGHQDGVFACGADADSTGAVLLSALAHALT
jgi:hypothetical protein